MKPQAEKPSLAATYHLPRVVSEAEAPSLPRRPILLLRTQLCHEERPRRESPSGQPSFQASLRSSGELPCAYVPASSRRATESLRATTCHPESTFLRISFLAPACAPQNRSGELLVDLAVARDCFLPVSIRPNRHGGHRFVGNATRIQRGRCSRSRRFTNQQCTPIRVREFHVAVTSSDSPSNSPVQPTSTAASSS